MIFTRIKPFWKVFGFYLECIWRYFVSVDYICMEDVWHANLNYTALHAWGHPHVLENISSSNPYCTCMYYVPQDSYIQWNTLFTSKFMYAMFVYIYDCEILNGINYSLRKSFFFQKSSQLRSKSCVLDPPPPHLLSMNLFQPWHHQEIHPGLQYFPDPHFPK